MPAPDLQEPVFGPDVQYIHRPHQPPRNLFAITRYPCLSFAEISAGFPSRVVPADAFGERRDEF
jgi:hypothetical protein